MTSRAGPRRSSAASCRACTGTPARRPPPVLRKTPTRRETLALRETRSGRGRRSSPRALRWALEAQRLLAEDWGVAAETWSATSWTELRRNALDCDEWNLLHPDGDPRVPHVTSALADHPGPVVAVSDWIRAVPDQIARWVSAPFSSLGTDGWGFSDTRPAARRFFHVDAESITLAVLSQLARSGELKPEVLGQAITKYRLDLDVSDAL